MVKGIHTIHEPAEQDGPNRVPVVPESVRQKIAGLSLDGHIAHATSPEAIKRDKRYVEAEKQRDVREGNDQGGPTR